MAAMISSYHHCSQPCSLTSLNNSSRAPSLGRLLEELSWVPFPIKHSWSPFIFEALINCY